jgi:undecaprenyl-diphosphatase
VGADVPRHPRRWRWAWIVGGWVATLLVGILMAMPLIRAGHWHDGAPWEIDVLRAVHGTLPLALDLAMLTLPWLGTNITLLPLSLIIAGIARARGRVDIAQHVLVVQLGAWALNPLLKELLERPRPEFWEHRGQYAFASYPSGHAITSIAVLLTYAAILHHVRGWRWPFLMAAVMIGVTLYSRLYLGVHWPWDVMAGGVMGVMWLVVTLVAFRYQRGSGSM